MKIAGFSLVLAAVSSVDAYTRLDKANAAMLFVDVQEGLFSIARDFNHVQMKQAFLAQAELTRIFDLPTVITSSADDGANGPIMSELTKALPNATIVRRTGLVNAWDDDNFRAAVEATGAKQVIVSGITTDVCTTFLSLSLVEAGYQVFANGEASGSSSEFVRDLANDRMRQGGVQVVSMFSIMSELMRSWGDSPGAVELLPFLDTYYPAYASVARSFTAASNSTS